MPVWQPYSYSVPSPQRLFKIPALIRTSEGRIQRNTWCMAPYAGVDYNLTLCPLRSRLWQPYAGVDRKAHNPMPESTLSPQSGSLDFASVFCTPSQITFPFHRIMIRYALSCLLRIPSLAWTGISLEQGVTRRCRLSLLTNNALVYRVPMLGGGGRGVAGSQPMNASVHITWHGAQINFGDIPPYLTYGLEDTACCKYISCNALYFMNTNTMFAFYT